MSKLDAIKEKLLVLEPGQKLRLHQFDVVDAMDDDRKERMFQQPPVEDWEPIPHHSRFTDWLRRNSIILDVQPAHDYCFFQKAQLPSCAQRDKLEQVLL